MALSLKIFIGIIVYYVIVGTLIGFIGQEIITNDAAYYNNVNLSEVGPGLDNNFSGEITATQLPGFIDGLKFGIDGLPTWLAFFLSAVLPIIMSLCVAYYIRGNG